MDSVPILQRDDGGFGWSDGEPSSIGATATALRVLRLDGGRVRDIVGCLRFVAACHDRAGGYADHPGGEIGIRTTADGIVASAELDELPIFWREAGLAYFLRNVRAFADVRIASEVLAMMRAASSAPRAWKDLALAGPITADHVVALASLGVAIPDRSAVVASLVDAPCATLAEAYRVVHALHLLDATPREPGAIRALIARPATIEEALFALSIARWLDGP